MKQLLLVLGLLLLGIGSGYLLAESGVVETRSSARTAVNEVREVQRFEDERRIRELEAEIERLRALLVRAGPAPEEPYPGDSLAKVERLLEEAYAENNVDWLLEVVDRLLAMGEEGYPLLRKLIMDLLFKSRFLPAESDFRIDQLYKLGRVFANREKNVIGFLNYLLLEQDTHAWLKQGAMMGGAFYVGSKAPGSEELQQTMMQMFLQTQGAGAMPGMIPGNMGKKMQIFAMAMSGNKEMIAPLRDEFRQTKDKDVQSDILGALAYLGDPGAVPLIKERLDPSQGDWRREINALGRVGTEDAHAVATGFLRAIPDSKRFYEHTRNYVRQGGGSSAVLLMRERIQADPQDPEVANTIGTLRRFPTQESLETLNLIATTNQDKNTQKRAADAAAEVDRRLKGEIPDPAVPR